MINLNLYKTYSDEIFTTISIDKVKPYYMLSNYGKVININTGKEIIPHVTENGYLQVSLMTYNGRIFRKVHRLVLLSFYYFPGCENLQVNHKDGNKFNNAYWNLEWVTSKENVQHAIETGLRNPFYGNFNPKSVINENTAIEIAIMLLCNYNHQFIADTLCNGNISIVREILYGRTWSHLFTKEFMNSLSLIKRGNIISIDDRHNICNFYQLYIDKYNGYGSVTKIIKDAIVYIGKDPNDDKIFRVAKRLFYRYESPEITSCYNY